jgi:hypothetical protein
MGRIFGLLVIVLGVWFAAQLYLGTAPFGLGAGGGADGAEGTTTVQRTGAKARAAYDDGYARREALLPDD